MNNSATIFVPKKMGHLPKNYIFIFGIINNYWSQNQEFYETNKWLINRLEDQCGIKIDARTVTRAIKGLESCGYIKIKRLNGSYRCIVPNLKSPNNG